ncbi:helix-turn-helix domain-containing protein [Kribbella speibonae]|uniref:helix-turn-helix domain-containing protein n=1 Tax=Kribbella speibonae TaxID=1572660 RepID=UPI001EDCAD7C|nr:AraC family transcriptional regulator [Kribbella speibonae]
MSLVTARGADPDNCDEFGYGIGTPGGILVLRYVAATTLEFGGIRQDWLHQLYWSPDGLMAVSYQGNTEFVGAGEAIWAQRAVSHSVQAKPTSIRPTRHTVYRLCLREDPPGLAGLRIGTARVPAEVAAAIQGLAVRGLPEQDGLRLRASVMHGLASLRDLSEPAGDGGGFALRVARALTNEPADPTSLDEWAGRLHVSAKTLQRDFQRQFGQSFSTWRASLRLRASLILLDAYPVSEVAHRVGYSSASAYIAAFRRTFGRTPGQVSD